MPKARGRDGVELRYEVFGEGEPLLLIPGLGASMRVWGGFPRAMGAHARVVAYDPRGFGDSPAPPATISIESMIADIEAVWDAAGLERGALFGVSMGGILAQRFASLHPDRVSGLVLVSTTGRMTRWARRMLDLFTILAERLPPAEYVSVMASLSLSPESVEAGSSVAADLERGLLPSPEEMPNILAQVEALRVLEDGRPGGPIRAPTLVLSGRRDLLTPPSSAEDLRRSIADARVEYLEGGHAALMEDTDTGMVAILAFLRETRVQR